MNRWEYRIINFEDRFSVMEEGYDGKTINAKKLEGELNLLGNEGWEVVGVCGDNISKGRIILKRSR